MALPSLPRRWHSTHLLLLLLGPGTPCCAAAHALLQLTCTGGATVSRLMRRVIGGGLVKQAVHTHLPLRLILLLWARAMFGVLQGWLVRE